MQGATGAHEASPVEVKQWLDAAKGKPVVVNLWATWCPQCVAEMPHLAEFYRQYAPKGVVFLSLSADDPKTTNTRVRDYYDQKKLPFPVFVLSTRHPDSMAAALRVELNGDLPTTLVYDRAGKLVDQHTGGLTLDELKAMVAPAL
jgi:thiol-disulfide isomerase/thioredoxin